jgi:hypothetical protein
MKAFAQLFLSLDETNKTNEKVKVLKDYFNAVPDTDKMHMLALFTGRKPKRIINSTFIPGRWKRQTFRRGCSKKVTMLLAIWQKPWPC